ncbi:hypothetical protein A2U01_0084570, partial [Trifolium medium]|nr:hypothetical protein [Trifolium medium]
MQVHAIGRVVQLNQATPKQALEHACCAVESGSNKFGSGSCALRR